MAEEGAAAAYTPEELARLLPEPRVVWLMVPAAVVDHAIEGVSGRLGRGDILIDGGNSWYVDDLRRAKELAARGIHYVDV